MEQNAIVLSDVIRAQISSNYISRWNEYLNSSSASLDVTSNLCDLEPCDLITMWSPAYDNDSNRNSTIEMITNRIWTKPRRYNNIDIE